MWDGDNITDGTKNKIAKIVVWWISMLKTLGGAANRKIQINIINWY